ncbi:secretion protein F [Rhodococcus spelaei]|uniref:Secretion protein F n=1 Tax=Rhodococcus spelaei TaxID=2546320 RepID=A0A541BRT0_9NOCA|nr:type II secretion system F family protein [Rhodococcus spelaei]TQF74979.1 secretion protein F [Rhodococcus spelaei]
MIPALLLCAVALLVAPPGDLRRRLRPMSAGPPPAVRVVGLRALGVGAIGVAAFVGPAAALAAAIVVGTTAHRERRRRLGRGRAAEQRGLLAALEVAVGELRVGSHPASACASAAQESKGAAAEAFRGAEATARLGGSAAEGLRVPGASIDADLDRIAAAWQVAERHGIALADLLDAARADLVGRIRFRGRVESGLAGARATAAVLAGLPLLGIALGQLMGAGPVRVLLSGGLGGILLVLGTVLACAGLLWTDRITGRVAA